MNGVPRVPVLDAGQAAAWDAASIADGIPSRVLMDAAGRAVAVAMSRECAAALPAGVLVVTGHGNNGGDGWVVARALHGVGLDVTVAESQRERSPDAEANRTLALREGVTRVGPDDVWPDAGVTVDAVLGTGASGVPRGDAATLARRIADRPGMVVAVDGPTGLDLSTGEAHGPVRAHLTVTFGGLRRGHLAAREWCGRILVAEMGFAAHTADAGWPWFVEARATARVLPPFTTDMHKGRRGKVLVIGGEEGMAGAVHHAGRAALASGAGLVRLAAAAASVAPLQETLPDATVLACPLGPDLDADLGAALDWADCVVIGPGLGRGDPRNRLVEAVLARTPVPVVIDADALHAGRDVVGRGEGDRVFTPHAGEFAVLFPELRNEVVTDRYAAAVRAATLVGSGERVVLLKGVPTIIATAEDTRVVGSGNPALATGGSGDVLSGIIGGLIGRGTAATDAAAAAAYVMGRAADIAAESRGVAVTRPADVIDTLGAVWRELDAPPALSVPFLLDLAPPQLT